MSSAVYYKFKSQRNESRIAIDGTGISVLDLKREIIQANDLGKAMDIDLQVFEPKGEQEYPDDHLIPRSSSVIVKRVPLPRGAKSKFMQYLSGASKQAAAALDGNRRQPPIAATWTGRGYGGFSKRFDGKDEPKEVVTAVVPTTLVAGVSDSEQAAIAGMFKAAADEWQVTQEAMSQQQRVYTAPRFGGGGGGAGTAGAPRRQYQHPVSEKPVPPGYICYRCGQKGHWIQDCPTNNDPEYDKKRIKRTTGIPRSFLKSVEPTEGAPLAQGVMVTPDGGYVIAQPDTAAWERQKTRSKGVTESEIRDRQPSDPSLACPLCAKLIRDAVKTPCCSTSFCEECIHTHLLDHEFTCPNCGSRIATLDRLILDKEMRVRVREYIDRTLEEGRRNENRPGMEQNTNPNEQQDDLVTDQAEMDGMMLDPIAIQRTIQEMQAQLTQLQRMTNDPNVPQQGRKNAQMQANDLTMRIQQAQFFLNMATTEANGGGGSSGGGQGAFKQGEYRPGWSNPFPNQQPANNESPYQRLPVNPNRRRTQKRPADWDVDTREPKVARYWE